MFCVLKMCTAHGPQSDMIVDLYSLSLYTDTWPCHLYIEQYTNMIP